MDLHFVVAVWGEWHLEMLERATAPSLFAPGNLPAVLQRHSGQMTILTRRQDVDRLKTMDAIGRLARMLPIHINAVTSEPELSSALHHRWWDACVDEARRARRKIILIHPDTIWADGGLRTIVDALDGECRAALMPPNLRVVSETIVPEVERRFGREISIPPADLVRMALRHLHPLSAMAMVGFDTWIPTPERVWPVPGAGLLVRTAFRPVVAFDPMTCSINAKYFIANATDLSEIHTVDTEEDGLFVSLAPLAKDHGLFLFADSGRPLDLGRWSVNPDQDVLSNRHLASRISRLAYRAGESNAWHRAVRRSNAFMARVTAWRRASRLWMALESRGEHDLAKMLAFIIQCVDVPRLVREPGPLTILLPGETALAAIPTEARNRVLAHGNEALLRRIVLRHIVPGTVPQSLPGDGMVVAPCAGSPVVLGQSEVRVLDRFIVDDLAVFIIDRVLED